MSYGNQKKVDQMDAHNGRMLREDNTAANVASVLSPKPTEVETVTVSSTAVGLTAAKYAGAVVALVTVETAPIRVWCNGTAPTSSAGTLMNAGDQRLLQSPEEIAGFKAIAVSADATIQVEYGG
ncbi:MAG: hypothetical protein GX616_02250 [Planctomycetes bacterium]|nr:hypothetical protein [Planctomycetota bacterium]